MDRELALYSMLFYFIFTGINFLVRFESRDIDTSRPVLSKKTKQRFKAHFLVLIFTS